MSRDTEARLADLERQLADLLDREAIRNIIHRYCRAADRCDLEAFKACYWPDGHDDHGFFGGNAHEFCDYVIPVPVRRPRETRAWQPVRPRRPSP